VPVDVWVPLVFVAAFGVHGGGGVTVAVVVVLCVVVVLWHTGGVVPEAAAVSVPVVALAPLAEWDAAEPCRLAAELPPETVRRRWFGAPAARLR
jgi:hypothetical protein